MFLAATYWALLLAHRAVVDLARGGRGGCTSRRVDAGRFRISSERRRASDPTMLAAAGRSAGLGAGADFRESLEPGRDSAVRSAFP